MGVAMFWEYSPELLAVLPKITPEQGREDMAKLAERHAQTLARIT